MSTFLMRALPLPIVGDPGSVESLDQIIHAAFGSGADSIADYWITYTGAATLAADNFSYWDTGSPVATSWSLNGTDIGPDFGNQTHLSATEAANAQLNIGNDIAPLAFITVPTAFDANHNPTEFVQYDIPTVLPSLMGPHAMDGAPTPDDIVASAKAFAAHYGNVVNNNDCGFIADDVAAAAGATLCAENTQSLTPSENEAGGFWRIAYRGVPVSDWHTLVKPGDIVRMGNGSGMHHTTTILGVNADGSMQVYDNGDVVNGQTTIGIHNATYDQTTDPSMVTIFRLASDHLYLIQGSSSGEALTGTRFNDLIDGHGGDDALDGGLGKDTLWGGTGSDRFYFSTPLSSSNVDKVKDFSHGHDKIELSSAIFTNAGMIGTLKTVAFHQGTAAHDASDRIIYNASNGHLTYDRNGSAAGGVHEIAVLSTGLHLTHNDFKIF